MPNTKSLILLGSTGFLGAAILDSLKSKPLLDLDILTSKSSPPNEAFILNLLGPDFTSARKIESARLLSALNSDVTIINCASSRNSKNEELSLQGNYKFPKEVLETLLAINGVRIRWIQIETFWQYSKCSSPDDRYVYWKNQFGNLLIDYSSNENVMIEKVILPHLIGPFDSPHRFLPRLFLKILNGERISINSPEEIFCIADVRDVARYLVGNIYDNSRRISPLSALFPFTEIQLREIVHQFSKITSSGPQIEFLNTLESSNPILHLSEQPPLLEIVGQSLLTLDTTLSDTAKWLSGLEHIDSL